MKIMTAARVDKWLWALRLYRTRSAAIAACQGGHVKVGGLRVKPAREVRPGDTLEVTSEGLVRTVRVKAAIEQRIGASRVGEFLEDLTPPEELERARMARQQTAPGGRPPGGGRPTKKERRQLEALEF